MSKVFIEVTIQNVYITNDPSQLYTPNQSFTIQNGTCGYLCIYTNSFEHCKETYLLWNPKIISEKTPPIKIKLPQIRTFKRFQPEANKSQNINDFRPLEFFQVVQHDGTVSPILYFTAGGAAEFFAKLNEMAQAQKSSVNSVPALSPPPSTIPSIIIPSTNLQHSNSKDANNNNTTHKLDGVAPLPSDDNNIQPLHPVFSTSALYPNLNYRNYKQFDPKQIHAYIPHTILYQNPKHYNAVGVSAPQNLNNAKGISVVSIEVRKKDRLPPLSMSDWVSSFDIQGKIKSSSDLRRKIYFGGIDQSIRPIIWKYLLRFYQFENTLEERENIKRQKDLEYKIYLNQWQSITVEQEQHFSKYRNLKERIHKDVVRTDRSLQIYKDENGPYLRSLYNILMTYSFFNFDIGYVQGMNDLVSIFLIVMDGNESDAFWCFKGMMDKIMNNFDKGQSGLHKQLIQMGEILRETDHELYSYLERQNCLNLFFCFKWLLIMFKREFEIDDVQVIWDCIFSCYYSSDHQIFVCLAMLIQLRDRILNGNLEFDDILLLLNNMAMKMDCKNVLIEADYLFCKFYALDPQIRDQIMVITPPKDNQNHK